MKVVVFAEEFVVIDALVFILPGVMSIGVGVYQLLNKNTPAEKKLSFIITLIVGVVLLAIGLYLIITGKSLR